MQTLTNQIAAFSKDESGATTTDWVVLTGMLVGLAIATATQVYQGSENTTLQLSGLLDSTEAVRFQGEELQFAQHFYDIGIAAHPGSRDDAWLAAREAVHAAAPSGFDYDPGFTTTRYIDSVSGYPIYISEDGQTYSIGGQTMASADYDTGNQISFRNAFNAYYSGL